MDKRKQIFTGFRQFGSVSWMGGWLARSLARLPILIESFLLIRQIHISRCHSLCMWKILFLFLLLLPLYQHTQHMSD